jgi:hypothetical protein
MNGKICPPSTELAACPNLSSRRADCVGVVDQAVLNLNADGVDIESVLENFERPANIKRLELFDHHPPELESRDHAVQAAGLRVLEGNIVGVKQVMETPNLTLGGDNRRVVLDRGCVVHSVIFLSKSRLT